MENISFQKNEEIQDLNNNNSLNLTNNNNENSNIKDKSQNKSFLNDSTNSFNFEAPIKLIDFEGSKFKLNPAAIDFLKSITDDLIIVSVVGKARTGKSYLMNLLLDLIGKTKGFDVDSTINSCTKGIWIWGGTRKKQGSNEKIIFIDSEGTSSIDRSTKTYDSKIFALVVLISSLFIYNTTGNIDENSISELSLAAHLSSSIAANATEEKEGIILELSPKFIWVIRDFTLNKTLPGTDIEIDNKEYLEISLRKKTSGKNSADNNLIRENIMKYFQDRDCVTLPRPVEDEADLRNLKNIPFENLKPNFKLEYNFLKNKIFKESKAKRFRGKALNGITLANLITAFIDSMNSGLVPNISNTWDGIIKDEINSCVDSAILKFKNSMKVFASENYEQENLIVLIRKEYIKVRLSVLDVLKRNPDVLYNDKYMLYYKEKVKSMESECEALIKKREEDNYEKTKKVNINLFKNEFRIIQNKIFRNDYGNENLRNIKIDLTEFYEKFQKESIGPTKNDVFVTSLCSGWKDIVFYLVTTASSSNKTKILAYENQLTAYKNIFEETSSEIKEMENNLEKQNFKLQNLESENTWKSRECGYLYDKIKNLEAALEKARLKDMSNKYDNNGTVNNFNNNNDYNNISSKNNNNNNNNNLKYSVSEFNDFMENTTKTKQNTINTKDYYEHSGNGHSKIAFEDGSGRDECACNCAIY